MAIISQAAAWAGEPEEGKRLEEEQSVHGDREDTRAVMPVLGGSWPDPGNLIARDDTSASMFFSEPLLPQTLG